MMNGNVMKKYILLVALVFLHAGILHASSVQAAVGWQSYSDPARTIVCDNFTSIGYVYMKGTGLTPNKTYTAKFYDAKLVCVGAEIGAARDKEFLSMIMTNKDPNAAPGLWTAELYDWKACLVARDTFIVSSSAIPEFPTVYAGMVACAICAMLYVFFKRGGLKWQRSS